MTPFVVLGTLIGVTIIVRLAFAAGRREANAPVVIIRPSESPAGGGLADAIVALGIFVTLAYFLASGVPY